MTTTDNILAEVKTNIINTLCQYLVFCGVILLLLSGRDTDISTNMFDLTGMLFAVKATTLLVIKPKLQMQNVGLPSSSKPSSQEEFVADTKGIKLHLSSTDTELTIQLIKTFEGDESLIQTWLTSNLAILDHQSPIQYLVAEERKRELKEVLRWLQHGELT